MSADSCSGKGGPEITLSGELVLEGIDALLIFRNNQKGTHETEADVEIKLVILPAGESITFAKQPPLGGVGGNPLIFLQFVDGNGNPLGDEIFLGRCNQLSK